MRFCEAEMNIREEETFGGEGEKWVCGEPLLVTTAGYCT